MTDQITDHHSAMITNPGVARAFVFGGNATFTLVAVESGKRYTYKVKAPWDGSKFEIENPRRFVSVRTGADDLDYEYIGFFYDDRLNAGKKGNVNHPAFKALSWFITGARIAEARGVEIPQDKVQFWHEGHCARCGRALTVPASIERGFGPDCAAALGMET